MEQEKVVIRDARWEQNSWQYLVRKKDDYKQRVCVKEKDLQPLGEESEGPQEAPLLLKEAGEDDVEEENVGPLLLTEKGEEGDDEDDDGAGVLLYKGRLGQK